MSEQITGTVSYLERIAMPPSAIVRVALVDAPVDDGPPQVLAEFTTEMGDRQVPIPFAIELPEDGVADALQAEIAVDGQVQFATPEAIPLPSDGGPRNDIAIRVHKTS
jgi:uncharacterized lipoprotein YbaY